jgi:ubiquinone/menaquinone biosynthesis C-methylase UbiE
MKIESEILRKTLSRPDLHTKWVNVYYSGRNNNFYEIAFDYIKRILGSVDGETILDAGCGNGAHSVRLAQRGFNVTAVDFSDEALKLCKENLKYHNLDSIVELQKESLLALNFKEDSFDNVLCWGVLMHIPEIRVALNELCRVLKPGGHLILCEVSKNSLETIGGRVIKKILKRQSKEKQTEAGIECWTETPSGNFLVRKTNFKWLKSFITNKKFYVLKHFPSQFTELYTRVSPKFLKNMIMVFNEIWFKYIKLTSPSLAQIIIFRKNGN